MEKIPETMRGVKFWTDEIKRVGVFEQIPPFNDLITGKTKPIQDINPVVENVMLGGKKVDIYHWGGTSARIYLHIKE